VNFLISSQKKKQDALENSVEVGAGIEVPVRIHQSFESHFHAEYWRNK